MKCRCRRGPRQNWFLHYQLRLRLHHHPHRKMVRWRYPNRQDCLGQACLHPLAGFERILHQIPLALLKNYHMRRHDLHLWQ